LRYNGESLREDSVFRTFVFGKMEEHFYSKDIYNICFTDDDFFTDWSNVKPMIMPTINVLEYLKEKLEKKEA